MNLPSLLQISRNLFLGENINRECRCRLYTHAGGRPQKHDVHSANV